MALRVGLLLLAAVGCYFSWVVVVPYAVWVIADTTKDLLIPKRESQAEISELRKQIEELSSRLARVEFNQV